MSRSSALSCSLRGSLARRLATSRLHSSSPSAPSCNSVVARFVLILSSRKSCNESRTSCSTASPNCSRIAWKSQARGAIPRNSARRGTVTALLSSVEPTTNSQEANHDRDHHPNREKTADPDDPRRGEEDAPRRGLRAAPDPPREGRDRGRAAGGGPHAPTRRAGRRLAAGLGV